MKLLDFNKTFKDEESCEEYLRELCEKDGMYVKAVVVSANIAIDTTLVGKVLKI